METRCRPERDSEGTGICQRCGKTFVDVFDFQGDVLPAYVPVRLVERQEGEDTILGEWCSHSCFLDEAHRDLESMTKRILQESEANTCSRTR